MGRYKSHEIHQYPEEALSNALQAIREDHGRLERQPESWRYEVPRGTIQDRLHGRVKEAPCKIGPGTIQTKITVVRT